MNKVFLDKRIRDLEYLFRQVRETQDDILGQYGYYVGYTNVVVTPFADFKKGDHAQIIFTTLTHAILENPIQAGDQVYVAFNRLDVLFKGE